MDLPSKLKQYYRYRRNWKKVKTRRAKGGLFKNVSEQLNFYSQLIRNGDLVFDVGANVGEKTELFLQLGAKVVAVEPQESCWRVLKRRFKEKDVDVEACAIADTKGERTLFIDRSPTLSSISQAWIKDVKESGRFSLRHKWFDKMSVPTTTLDALIEKYGKPVFCKIDVEGAELDVLKGLSEPVKTISFEFISEQINVAISCIDYLSTLGRARFNYHFGEAVSFAAPNWFDSEQIKTTLKAMNSDIENFGDIYVRFQEK